MSARNTLQEIQPGYFTLHLQIYQENSFYQTAGRYIIWTYVT